MGKKTANLTGLSRYVLDALKESQENSGSTALDSQVVTVPDLKLKRHDVPPTKRRKTGNSIAGPGKYDATGLVPHYKNAHQVPEYLQKCKVSIWFT